MLKNIVFLARHRFDAASDRETIVFGSSRPGYPSNEVPRETVAEWIKNLQDASLKRILCLLDERQLSYYEDLAGDYRRGFGASKVLMAPVPDYQLATCELMDQTILPFLFQADKAHEACLVHCSGGYGRTGHVLAAWLVAGRGMTPEAAILQVKRHGRSPAEALNGNEAELARWLAHFVR